MYTHFTVHGIQMDSILSNEHCIRDFIKNVLLSKQESTVKGAKVSPHFIPKFLNSNHTQGPLSDCSCSNQQRGQMCLHWCQRLRVHTVQFNATMVRIKANSQQAIRAPVSGGGIIKVFLQRSTTRHY